MLGGMQVDQCFMQEANLSGTRESLRKMRKIKKHYMVRKTLCFTKGMGDKMGLGREAQHSMLSIAENSIKGRDRAGLCEGTLESIVTGGYDGTIPTLL